MRAGVFAVSLSEYIGSAHLIERLSERCWMIRLDGFSIPNEAVWIHGTTFEIIPEEGFDLSSVIQDL